MTDKATWVWMPHPAHFICAHDCRFHLATCVGDYIVSTVGEYEPDSAVREILAESRGITLEGRGDARRADYHRKLGWEEIGLNRLYETMVFPAVKRDDPDEQCCPFKMANPSELDSQGYNGAAEAYRGHLAMCEKWAAESARVLEAEGGGK